MKNTKCQNNGNSTESIICENILEQIQGDLKTELDALKQKLIKDFTTKSTNTVDSFLRDIMDRLEPDYPLELKQHIGQNSGEYKLSKQIDKIRDIVIGNVISSKDLCEEIINKFGTSERTARRCMSKAINDGKINCSSIGKYKYYFVDFADFETFRTEAVCI